MKRHGQIFSRNFEDIKFDVYLDHGKKSMIYKMAMRNTRVEVREVKNKYDPYKTEDKRYYHNSTMLGIAIGGRFDRLQLNDITLHSMNYRQNSALIFFKARSKRNQPGRDEPFDFELA